MGDEDAGDFIKGYTLVSPSSIFLAQRRPLTLKRPLPISDVCRLSDHYAFEKPNDRRALDLMNAAAVEVMKELPDLCIAYGVSDEYRYENSSLSGLYFLTNEYVQFCLPPWLSALRAAECVSLPCPYCIFTR